MNPLHAARRIEDDDPQPGIRHVPILPSSRSYSSPSWSSSSMKPGCFAYYCSGHGYGHATRVSAFTIHLLRLPENQRPIVYIVSSAPKHVFSDAIDHGALYRYAEIDPVIVQPLAYRVDRQKSVQVLKNFLSRKGILLEAESRWLKDIGASCVLSDAAFLGCLAAESAGIPSALITNFTFDSVYSYLATTFIDGQSNLKPNFDSLVTDIPIPRSELDPLVDQIHAGYRCADLLLLLPGQIPIPSFSRNPSLPAPDWVNLKTHCFFPEVVDHCLHKPHLSLLPPVSKSHCPRRVIPAPLLVRPPVSAPYSLAGRSRFLSDIGIPEKYHNHKILVVSFGGQIFKRPCKTDSPRSRNDNSVPGAHCGLHSKHGSVELSRVKTGPIATESHIWVPGAPPAMLSPSLSSSSNSFTFTPSPNPSSEDIEDPTSMLLPDSSWIAVVCGSSKSEDEGEDEGLPDGFFVAPRDVYMPDLTAIADVLLGKLGYGTVSECVDTCTAFVYVSRPLFIEEHGLRLLLEKDGVGVELSREAYEGGEWATAVLQAYTKGNKKKEAKRGDMNAGVGTDKIEMEGRKMAEIVVNWERECWTSYK